MEHSWAVVKQKFLYCLQRPGITPSKFGCSFGADRVQNFQEHLKLKDIAGLIKLLRSVGCWNQRRRLRLTSFSSLDLNLPSAPSTCSSISDSQPQQSKALKSDFWLFIFELEPFSTLLLYSSPSKSYILYFVSVVIPDWLSLLLMISIKLSCCLSPF